MFASSAHADNTFLFHLDSAAENSPLTLQKLELSSVWTLDEQLAENWTFRSSVRARADSEDALEPGRPTQQERSRYNRRWLLGDDGEVELRDLYVDGAIGGARVRIGKQQIAWGQADGLRVLDLVNPYSFREFILPRPEDRRIGLWTVNSEVPLGKATLQLLWIPDPTYDEIPLNHEPFAVTSTQFVPHAPAGIPVRTLQYARPHGLFESSDAGAKLSTFAGGWDLSLNYLYHYYDDPVPFVSITAGGVVVEPRYERSQLIGGSFSNAFGHTTVRGEVGYSTHRWFLTTDIRDPDKVFPSDELAWVIGFDNTRFEDTLLSVQYYESRLQDVAHGATRDPVEREATALIQRDFANQTFRLRGLWLASLNHADGAIQMQFSWQVRSSFSAMLAVERFYGNRNGLFGEFADASRFGLNFEWGL